MARLFMQKGIYQKLCPTMPEIIPSWSPVKFYGGFQINIDEYEEACLSAHSVFILHGNYLIGECFAFV
jgi:hypothetical protein